MKELDQMSDVDLARQFFSRTPMGSMAISAAVSQPTYVATRLRDNTAPEVLVDLNRELDFITDWLHKISRIISASQAKLTPEDQERIRSQYSNTKDWEQVFAFLTKSGNAILYLEAAYNLIHEELGSDYPLSLSVDNFDESNSGTKLWINIGFFATSQLPDISHVIEQLDSLRESWWQRFKGSADCFVAFDVDFSK